MRHTGISFPEPWIETAPPAVDALCLNHWTAREVQILSFCEVFAHLESRKTVGGFFCLFVNIYFIYLFGFARS